jgi:hypothetical protein
MIKVTLLLTAIFLGLLCFFESNGGTLSQVAGMFSGVVIDTTVIFVALVAGLILLALVCRR